MMTWLRRLARRARRLFGKHPGRRVQRDAFNHTVMCLPRTLPPLPADPGPWPPRITRWVRLACPQPDDTIISMPAVIR